MILINLHAVPTKESEYFNQFIGSYVSVYIDYSEVSGAIQLAKYYVEEEGWVVNNIDDEYYVIDKKDDLESDQQEFFSEAKEYGYTMVFNAYESVEE